MVKCGMICKKYLLFLFNLLFVVSGICMIVIGVIVKIKEISIFGDSTYLSLPIIIISTGAFTFLLAFLGCCGAIKESICKLSVFGILMLVLLICQIAGIILAFANRGTMDAVIKDNMNSTLKDQKEAAVTAWKYMQAGFHCCGVDGPEDYLADKLDIPRSCCEPSEEDCSKDKAFRNGCYDRLVAFVNSKVKIFAGVGGIVAAVELVSVIFTFCLISYIREKNKPSASQSSEDYNYNRY
ncbi:hypothetical protein JTE90_005762 [Oedothorax gibbosus]|uniref:Tetraspanin n=1 Tax=Oedothorax gibbosus TaxID=931172 RepID=A0AAV6UR88_9ARAC|nr:hypothetical protein JTE90_005762 [Oedothorax gibbosus]